MKKICMGALTLILVAFSACKGKDNPQTNVMDGQWVMEELGTDYYWDINHQMPNVLLKGTMDTALQAPFAYFEDSIQSIVYSDDQQSCTITMAAGQVFRFEDITATSCTYIDGEILVPCARPATPFTFKTVHDIDTVTPVQWDVRFYVNDSLLAFYDCSIVDSTAAGVTEYTITKETFDAKGRDTEAWKCIQDKGYPFTESQLYVLTAKLSMKSGNHIVYLKLNRTATPATGLASATLMYGYKASTTATSVYPNSVKSHYGIYHNYGTNTVDALLAAVPELARKQHNIRIDFAKF